MMLAALGRKEGRGEKGDGNVHYKLSMRSAWPEFPYRTACPRIGRLARAGKRCLLDARSRSSMACTIRRGSLAATQVFLSPPVPVRLHLVVLVEVVAVVRAQPHAAASNAG